VARPGLTPNTPRWVNHPRVESEAKVDEARKRLEQALMSWGPVLHDGFVALDLL
jgi:hypothetical protein